MSRKALAGWIAIVLISGLVGLGAILAHRYRWELRWNLARLESTNPLDLRVGVFSPDREVEIYRNETLRLAGREYEPAGGWKATVLLLHGRTSKGSNLAFYRVLARRLADLGYFVVASDFAGFGRSGDPFSDPYVAGSSGDYDVRAWLGHLTSDLLLSSKPLFIVAHSAGASSGLPIGLTEGLVRGIVAIGPSRDVIKDLSDPEQADYWWSRNQATHREVYGREFPDWYSKERWLSEALGVGSAVGLKRPMEVFLPQLQDPGHHPVLLIDGERELEEDKLYLQAYYEAMVEPKDYHTLSGADHYSNVAHVGSWAIYDRRVVDETVSVIDEWMTEIMAADPAEDSKP